jgi:hypothetical protein
VRSHGAHVIAEGLLQPLFGRSYCRLSITRESSRSTPDAVQSLPRVGDCCASRPAAISRRIRPSARNPLAIGMTCGARSAALAPETPDQPHRRQNLSFASAYNCGTELGVGSTVDQARTNAFPRPSGEAATSPRGLFRKL